MSTTDFRPSAEETQPRKSTRKKNEDYKSKVKAAAVGRWGEILSEIGGVSPDYFDGRQQACPKCGDGGHPETSNRFRTLNDFGQTGAVFCNQCFNKKNGDGFAALEWLTGDGFADVLTKVGNLLGISRPIKSKAPDSQLEFLRWNQTAMFLWALKKPPVQVAALEKLGARYAKYRKRYTVIAIPVWGPELDSRPAVGWIIYRSDGGDLPKFSKGSKEPTEWKKVLLTKDSTAGLVCCLDDWRNVSSDQTWWKLEGSTDLLAAISAEGWPDGHRFFTTANGTTETPKPWMVDTLTTAGCQINVCHDADKPGQDGAAKWSKALGARNVCLPFPVETTSGTDIRDFFGGGGSVATLLELATKAKPWKYDPEVAAAAVEDIADRQFTDTANGERFAALHGGIVRYVHTWDMWYAYDGHRWRSDDDGQVMRLAKKTARSIYAEAAECRTGDDADSLAKWAKASHAKGRLDAMLSLAKSEQPIPITHEHFDSDPFLLNCANGTVDLTTGQLRPHNAGDMLTMTTGVEYHADQPEADLWEKFLVDVFAGDADLISYVQRLMGVALVGVQIEHLLPILWGRGHNGKSVFLGTIQAAMGDYAIQASRDMLTDDAHPTALADLYRRRLAVISETDEGQRLAEGLVKAITGGDQIRARRMRENFWEFAPSHLPIMVTNHKPSVRGNDDGIWRRLKLIPFSVKIAKPDRDLPAKLANQLPSVLRWMVQGCIAYQTDGLAPEPDVVQMATTQYRSESDTLATWVSERCESSPDYSCRCGDAWEDYLAWCESLGHLRLGRRKFGERMQELYQRSGRTSTGYHYIGCRLIPDAE